MMWIVWRTPENPFVSCTTSVFIRDNTWRKVVDYPLEIKSLIIISFWFNEEFLFISLFIFSYE